MSVLWENTLLAIVIAECKDSEILFFNGYDRQDTHCVCLEGQPGIRPDSTQYTLPGVY
jgi:hypothetical protein